MVFDSISWGEIFVVGAVGAALTGRRDLPGAFRYVGTQLGRVVGLLQGARARADQFAAQNELKQLQNELRSGLRELDQVKAELAVAASSQGIVGRNLGTTTGLANRQKQIRAPVATDLSNNSSTFMTSTAMSPNPMGGGMASVTRLSSQPLGSMPPIVNATAPIPALPPAYRTERATIEEEWEKRGIGFRSVAERGAWLGNNPSDPSMSNNGSELLANLIKQNLIFDQYDRVVGEQQAQLEERIEKAKEKRRTSGSDENENSKPKEL